MEGSEGEQPPPALPTQPFSVMIGGRSVTVTLTRHASDRIEERGISVDEVSHCLRAPDVRNLPTNEPDKSHVRRHLESNRSVDVIYCWESDDCIMVITAYYVSGSKR